MTTDLRESAGDNSFNKKEGLNFISLESKPYPEMSQINAFSVIQIDTHPALS